MHRIAVAVMALGALATTGCATGARAYMDSTLGNRSESATVWNRPQEVGFDWGAEINGEASRQCVLMFICWGYEDGGGFDLGALLGGLLGGGGSKSVSDPLVRAAAAVAVANAPKADGLFVVSHDTDSFNIFIYSRRSARVRGKSFTLRPMGEVSQERSDKVRNLSAMGNTTISLPMP